MLNQVHYLSMFNDQALSELVESVTISEGGYVPINKNIHVISPKPTSWPKTVQNPFLIPNKSSRLKCCPALLIPSQCFYEAVRSMTDA